MDEENDIFEVPSTSAESSVDSIEIIWHPALEENHMKYIKGLLIDVFKRINSLNGPPMVVVRRYQKIFAVFGVRNRVADAVWQKYQFWNAFMNKNQRALETRLAHHPYLRYYQNKRIHENMQKMELSSIYFGDDLFSEYPMLFYTCLQAVIQNFQTSLETLGEQLIQIAHSHALHMGERRFHNDVMAHLNEALLTALGLGLTKAQEEIITFESFVSSRNKKHEYTVPWMAWKILWMVEKNVSGDYGAYAIDAARLAEYADSDAEEEIGVCGSVFVETACRIWKHSRNSEQHIMDSLSSTIKLYPALAPRLVQVASNCGLEFEKDVLIEDACRKMDEHGLHPSEPLWLDWCEARLKNLTRYGAVVTTLTKCVKVLFGFLDFGSNRNSSRAWTLLHEAVQKALPDVVFNEWKPRSSWWPRFHADVLEKKRHRPRKSSEEEILTSSAKNLKMEVLSALQIEFADRELES
ncbi:unnamed protein product [Caenorhabditis auriculariae]|uniref:Uncharacterized protein n=1 Tax=Caenorhabditis auriculariae TaxID=2777116 RepID=A0A8S1H6X4_9PELO|nr:unnamed protein product [Caenorhabditis auriculariae]